MKTQLQRHYKRCDWLAGIAIVLFILTHTITQGVIMHESDRTKAEYEDVSKNLELNPLANYAFMLLKFSVVLRIIVLPAFVGVAYWMVRRRSDLLTVQFVSSFLFLAAFINITHDIGALIGHLV